MVLLNIIICYCILKITAHFCSFPSVTTTTTKKGLTHRPGMHPLMHYGSVFSQKVNLSVMITDRFNIAAFKQATNMFLYIKFSICIALYVYLFTILYMIQTNVHLQSEHNAKILFSRKAAYLQPPDIKCRNVLSEKKSCSS